MSAGMRTICKSGRESDGEMGRNTFSFILTLFTLPLPYLINFITDIFQRVFYPLQNTDVVAVVKTLEIHFLPLEGRQHKLWF